MSSTVAATSTGPALPTASARPSAVITAAHLTKSWGANRVLDGAEFTIGRGVTGLLGANGAGKTTLFGLVLGFGRPDSGSLTVLGRDPHSAGPDVRARIGYAPEHDALPVDMRAHDFVRHVAELHGIPSRDAIARASDTLFEVGLGEERFRPVGTMSTGQKQRVKLAQAIVHDPELVLLDEPTNGLDPVQREQMLALITRCGTVLGLDIVLSSHLLEEVERTCSDVVILANGHARVEQARRDVGDDPGAAIEVELVVPPAWASAGRAAEWTAQLAAYLCANGVTAAVTAPAAIDVHGAVDEKDAGRDTTRRSPDVFDRLRDLLVAADAPVRLLRRRRRRLADDFLAASLAGTGDPTAAAAFPPRPT